MAWRQVRRKRAMNTRSLHAAVGSPNHFRQGSTATRRSPFVPSTAASTEQVPRKNTQLSPVHRMCIRLGQLPSRLTSTFYPSPDIDMSVSRVETSTRATRGTDCDTWLRVNAFRLFVRTHPVPLQSTPPKHLSSAPALPFDDYANGPFGRPDFACVGTGRKSGR